MPTVVRSRRSRRIIYQATTRPARGLNRSAPGGEGRRARTARAVVYPPEMIEDSSQSPGEHRVVKAYLFDTRQGEIVED